MGEGPRGGKREAATAQDGVTLIGRILLAAMFVISGWGKLTGFAGTAGYISSQGLPLPALFAAAAIVIELGGGLLILLGWKARWAALGLALFLVIITPIFHNFWGAPPEARMGQLNQFPEERADSRRDAASLRLWTGATQHRQGLTLSGSGFMTE